MQKIRIDFDNPGLPQHISAVENDSQSRFFQATLYENGKAYTAPEGAAYSIMYRGFGPQNQGWYDTINDGAGKRAACAVSGNVVTCEIARQALQVPGHVSIVLCVTTGKGYMLKSWPIECDCKNDRYDSTTEIESFFYVTSVSNASWMQAIQAVEELKNTIDPTLSISGKAADAAAVGTRLSALSEETSELKGDLGDLESYIEHTDGYKKYALGEPDTDYYWVGSLKIKKLANVTNIYRCYEPISVKAGKYDFKNISPLFTFYVDSDTWIAFGTSSSPYNGTIVFEADTTLYITERAYSNGFHGSELTSGEYGTTDTNWFNSPKYNVEEMVSEISEMVIKTNHLYVSETGSDANGDGSQDNPFATIYHANEIITDASEKNKYIIHVADGIYTDLQSRYQGSTTHGEFEGITCKPWVIYEGNVNHPENVVIKWNGKTGYGDDFDYDNHAVHFCPFHITSNGIGDKIVRGFTFDCINTRYALHVEMSGYGYGQNWLVSDCNFIWGGTPDCPDHTYQTPCIGTGSGHFEKGHLLRCKIANASGITDSFRNHDSRWVLGTKLGNVPHIGAEIIIEDCVFNAGDSGDTNITFRNIYEDGLVDGYNRFSIINCTGINRLGYSLSGNATKCDWRAEIKCSDITKNQFTTENLLQ